VPGVASSAAIVEPPVSIGSVRRRAAVRVSRGPGRCRVTRAYAESPLKWLTPGNEGDAAWLFAASYGGGLVGGDHLALELEIDAGARAMLSTQASTKVYRSPAGASTALAARIGAGGLLASLPDPVVCFAASSYRQTQTFDLAGDAGLIALDWMTAGRCGSGERWAFDRYAAATSVCMDGRLVLHDAVRLDAADGDLAARLGRFDVLALLVIAGAPLVAAAGRVVAGVTGGPVERRPPVLASAAPMPGGAPGCVVRFAGSTLEEVRRAVRAALDFVPGLLGDDPWARKW
jgi:urease accessory protein